jgi:DNA-binding response OmpR family regulator
MADDEPKYVCSLTMILQAKGYDVVSAQDGEAAAALAAREAPA